MIFSVSESGHFQGYARLSKGSIHDPQVNWILPPHLSSKLLTKPFKLDWISKKDLPFNKVQHLLNSLNENKPVKIGRDGQVVKIQFYLIFFTINFFKRKLKPTVANHYVVYLKLIMKLI